MKTSRELRSDLLNFLARDLVGPDDPSDAGTLEDQPRIRYAAGVLFPQESVRNESEAVGGVEGDATAQEDAKDVAYAESEGAGRRPKPETEGDAYDDTINLANSYKPSAVGISFMVDAAVRAIRVTPQAAVYDASTQEVLRKDSDRTFMKTTWKRRGLQLEPFKISLDSGGASTVSHNALTEGLSYHCVLRPKPNNQALVTISLFNTSPESSPTAKTFFQTGFEVEGPEGSAPFLEYRELEGAPDDDEEIALAMLYRRRRTFAVGHGCAADWSETDEDRTTRVGTSTIPIVTVPPVEPVSGHHPSLDMQFLAGECQDPGQDIPQALRSLCEDYDGWISGLEREAGRLEERFHEAARRHIALCRTAARRMRAGIDVLAREPRALEAFMLANRAMIMQQFHSRLRRSLDDPWKPWPAEPEGYASNWGEKTGYWRTFQIAFFLMTVPGLIPGTETLEIGDETVAERDLVDLIWFPTGGGKTEAYLAVTAFTIFRQRLEDPSRSGCNALMRYTLRLLTSQQFQRAASLICACELLRRADPARFGEERISIGLWVGMSLTPNRERDALRDLARMERDARKGPSGGGGSREDIRNPFQLLSCPWCGTELDDPRRYGYVERRNRLVFQCPANGRDGNPACPFSTAAEHLPVCVVDESLYKEPSTLIIGTVDKFAMLAWRPEASALLKVGGGPDLIIQDELHLISGPLGSMVGLYEGVIDYLCSVGGRSPKIVASTATIRRAERQCRALYDRPMFQFPPSGLDASDSFFAEENRDAAGRTYVGFLPTAASSPLTAQIRSVVALQQGAVVVGDGSPDASIDPYWTLVQYFGSLKELGRAATFLTADIPEFLPTMHRRYELEGDKRRYMRLHEELTSRKNESEIPKILKRLEVEYEKGASFSDQALDTVLATNMISVGVDVDRLGLMMVVTQPKGTSEYIQASSRVGRSAQRPGLVFTLYNASRPRDRSHYEHFRGYHQAFYRYVEPTSVTPFSPPAMERALHAVLIIAGRHAANWQEPDELDRNDPEFSRFLEFLEDRVRSIDEGHIQEYRDAVERRLDEWERQAPEVWGDLSDWGTDPALMRPAGKPMGDVDDDNWEVPTSLRNVDVECAAEVVARYIPAERP